MCDASEISNGLVAATGSSGSVCGSAPIDTARSLTDTLAMNIGDVSSRARGLVGRSVVGLHVCTWRWIHD